MGIDFVDCCIRIEKEFDLPHGILDSRKLRVDRNVSGVPVGLTVGDIAEWVEARMVAAGREPPPDLWPRVQACIAATVYQPSEKVTPTGRLIEDLGFSLV